jgi:hypothetical protein
MARLPPLPRFSPRACFLLALSLGLLAFLFLFPIVIREGLSLGLLSSAAGGGDDGSNEPRISWGDRLRLWANIPLTSARSPWQRKLADKTNRRKTVLNSALAEKTNRTALWLLQNQRYGRSGRLARVFSASAEEQRISRDDAAIQARYPSDSSLRENWERNSGRNGCWKLPSSAENGWILGGLRPYETVERYAMLDGFDYAWRARETPFKVLVWADAASYVDAREGGDRLLFAVMEALAVHPQVSQVELWGTGFCDWEELDTIGSVRDKFQRRFGADGVEGFDFVLVAQRAGFRRDAPTFLRELGIPLGVILDDCAVSRKDERGCDDILQVLEPAFAIFASGVEMLQCCVRQSERTLFAVGPPHFALNDARFRGPVTLDSSPDSGSPSSESHNGDGTDPDGRDVDVVLPGTIEEVWSPVKAGIAAALGRQARVQMMADDGRDGDVVAWMATLRRAKIVVVDSSAFGLPVGALGEAACSGALVIGEVPQQAYETYVDMVVPLAANASDGAVGEVIVWWLEHGELRRQWTHRARALCRERLSIRGFVDVLLDAHEESAAHEFGISIQVAFHLACRATAGWQYDSGSNTWCDDLVRELSFYGSKPDGDPARSAARWSAMWWKRIAVVMSVGWVAHAFSTLFPAERSRMLRATWMAAVRVWRTALRRRRSS